jgi:ATP-dependent Lon protease
LGARSYTSAGATPSDQPAAGITINTGPVDFAPIKQVQLRRFRGEKWELFGATLGVEIGG